MHLACIPKGLLGEAALKATHPQILRKLLAWLHPGNALRQPTKALQTMPVLFADKNRSSSPGGRPIWLHMDGIPTRTRGEQIGGRITGWVIGAVAVVVLIGLVAPDPGNEFWTARNTVCDYNGECWPEVECRSTSASDHVTEVKLPTRTYSGNEDWEWQEDIGNRCGEPPS